MYQVRIQRFLEKKKKKKGEKDKKIETCGSNTVAREQEKLINKVTDLMKKQKLHQVRQIVKREDDFGPWGLDAKAKVVNLWT